MLELLKELYYKFRHLNRSRLEQKRLRKIIRDDLAPRNKPFPRDIKRILFIVNAGGYGDAICVAGLFKKLSEDGYILQVAVPERKFKLNQFSELTFLESCFRSDDIIACDRELDKKPDILIDLTWVGIKDWDSRQYLLRKAECFKVTVSDICDKLNIFDGFIDYRTVAHMSARLGLVRKFITGFPFSSHPIIPYIQLTAEENIKAEAFINRIRINNKKILFLNGLAGQRRHCMSDLQIKAVLDELAGFSNINILLNGDSFKNSILIR